MSSFNGEVKEIPFIAVDYFKNKAKCYFLSHCHSDHLVGLAELVTNSEIYASPVSALFIHKKFPHLENVKVIEIGITLVVELLADEQGDSSVFNVTAISAGHCAGSIMLLFQNELYDVLYTGDFRLSLKDVRNIKILKEQRRNFVVYMDSTFMRSSYANFPSQSQSANTIVEITKNFLKRSENNKVHIYVPARYGYEFLIMQLGQKLHERVWVCESSLEEYSLISGLSFYVTNNDRTSRIFIKSKYTDTIDHVSHVLTLQLSAMYWQNWSSGSFVKQMKENSFRVCYSTHSSLNEIQEFLLYLKPQKVLLNVVPDNVGERQKMYDQLAMIESHFKEKPKIEADIPKRFTFNKIKRT